MHIGMVVIVSPMFMPTFMICIFCQVKEQLYSVPTMAVFSEQQIQVRHGPISVPTWQLPNNTALAYRLRMLIYWLPDTRIMEPTDIMALRGHKFMAVMAWKHLLTEQMII